MKEIKLLVPDEDVERIIGLVSIMLNNSGFKSDINNNQLLRNDNDIDNDIYINNNSETDIDGALKILEMRGVLEDFSIPSEGDVLDYIRAKKLESKINGKSFYRSFEAKNWYYKGEAIRRWWLFLDKAATFGWFPGTTDLAIGNPEDIYGRPLPKTLCRNHMEDIIGRPLPDKL